MKRPENHFYIDKYGGKGFSIPTRWKSRNPPPPVLAPPRDNPNSNDVTQINIQDIATQVSPNFWIINKEVTIASGENLGIGKGSTVVTRYEFTNNGTFNNNAGGTFITSNKFTNNGQFSNERSFTVNLSGGQLIFNPTTDINIFNRGVSGSGSVILNLGTYTRIGKIVGNPVQSDTTLVKIDDWASLVKAILIVFTNSP